MATIDPGIPIISLCTPLTVNNLKKFIVVATATQSAVTANPQTSSLSGKSTVHSRVPSHELSNIQTNLL